MGGKGRQGLDGEGAVEVAERAGLFRVVMDFLMMEGTNRHPRFRGKHEFGAASAVMTLFGTLAAANTGGADVLAAGVVEHELFAELSIFEVAGVGFGDGFGFGALFGRLGSGRLGELFGLENEASAEAVKTAPALAVGAFLAGS